MTWRCGTCDYLENEDGVSACAACATANTMRTTKSGVLSVSTSETLDKQQLCEELFSTLGEAKPPTYAITLDERLMDLNLEDAACCGIDGAAVKAVNCQTVSRGHIYTGDTARKANETGDLCMSPSDTINVTRRGPPPSPLQLVPMDKVPGVQGGNSHHVEVAMELHQDTLSTRNTQQPLRGANMVLELLPDEPLGVGLLAPEEHYFVQHGLIVCIVEHPGFRLAVAPGDALVTIGSTPVRGFTFSESMERLRREPRPLSLTFEVSYLQPAVPDQIAYSTYSVTFMHGPFGLCVPCNRDHGIAIVTGVKGQAAANGVASGHLICSINGVDARGLDALTVRQQLRKASRPCTLVFATAESPRSLLALSTCGLKFKAQEKQHDWGHFVPQSQPTDISYADAKARVIGICARLEAIGGPNSVDKDLREEYYVLEIELERYMAAMMLTDEYAAEEAARNAAWEDANAAANARALRAVRRMLPLDVACMSAKDLRDMDTPSGLRMPRDVASKLAGATILHLLRAPPEFIAAADPNVLERLRITGLTLTERRALHRHLRHAVALWTACPDDDLNRRRLHVADALTQRLKEMVAAYDSHVAQYGPPDNHPYANAQVDGCPMRGRNCPVRADIEPAYTLDLGFPEDEGYSDTPVNLLGGAPSHRIL
ncbi:hypothetical protein ACHHYP_14975 [Achlya hypogyna]|uniref:PDZ domain-containing protein n=1 Tax=Achlya hypogyna TaxID=1202772 RepID=A0A1V9YBY8_ACHHY|nr:hypothetical protein ACHHYP_14975 [Achlya hypogyna]